MDKTLKIGINADAKNFVEQKAVTLGTSEAEVVRRALEAYRFLDDVKEKDGQVLLQRIDGQLERLARL